MIWRLLVLVVLANLWRLIGVAAVVLIALGVFNLVQADASYVGEEQTSWRAEDALFWRAWCVDEAAMRALIQAPTGTHERCSITSEGYYIAGHLVRWVAGPFEQFDMTGSIWEAQSTAVVSEQHGMMELPPEMLATTTYILLRDDGGKHEAEVAL